LLAVPLPLANVSYQPSDLLLRNSNVQEHVPILAAYCFLVSSMALFMFSNPRETI